MASLPPGAFEVPSAPEARPAGRSAWREGPCALQGGSEALRRVLALARAAARTDLPVVLAGEPGAGKGRLARAIHAAGDRSGGPFVPVDCAAVPLAPAGPGPWGHRDGSAPGARGPAGPGCIEAALGGTLFLDEVGALPPHAQAALLRLLEQQEPAQAGGGAPAAAGVRVVAATARSLRAEVRAHRLRRDLVDRLAVLVIRVPPLRERGEDVTELARQLLAEAGPQVGREGLVFDGAALAALRRYPWPGNVRELRNVVLRAAATAPGAEIAAADLSFGGGPAEPWPTASEAAAHVRCTLRAAVGESERARVVEALEACGWNFARTAQRLSVSRMTLYRLARKHGLARGARRR